MASVTVVSGLNGKLPAAFLLEAQNARILFDLGEGPEPGVRPNLNDLGTIDAIAISHAHIDHVGSLEAWAQLGSPLVYATERTWCEIEHFIPREYRVVVPEQGKVTICGITFTTGRSGHAPGGVWYHTTSFGGFIYMGDWSNESALLPFDMPPKANFLITDASYGDREETLCHQINQIMTACANGAVLGVPANGRGPEMAYVLSLKGINVQVCEAIANEISHLPASVIKDHLLQLPIATVNSAKPHDVIIATGPNAEYGLTAELLHRFQDGEAFNFVFSGHVPNNSPAHSLIADHKATWYGWNVHPLASHNLWLAKELNAKATLVAFAPKSSMPNLLEALEHRVSWTIHNEL